MNKCETSGEPDPAKKAHLKLNEENVQQASGTVAVAKSGIVVVSGAERRKPYRGH